MIICIAGSMQFTQDMLDAKAELESKGHTCIVSKFADSYIGKSDEEIEEIKLYHKYQKDAIREFWDDMQNADALVVINKEKHGIPGYVGGNTLMEIGFAHVLNLQIFLLNPIPNMPYCDTEIKAVKPVILNGDLGKIPE